MLFGCGATRKKRFTSYLLSIPETEIEAVLKGVSDRSLLTTVWESQIRSDGLAAWVNEWVIQDGLGSVAIGSNAHEWKTAEEYDSGHSTLYGSYSLYCQQTKRSAKTPQNFSAELLELTNCTLGWSTEKARATIGGKRVRVIKGLRLRFRSDNEQLTVEEILEGNRGGDNRVVTLVVNPVVTLKPLLNKEGDKGDNLSLNFEESETKLSSNYDNSITGTIAEEVENKISSNHSSVAVTPVTSVSQQGIEAVHPVVTSVVTPAVTANKEINWSSYPYNSSDHGSASFADRYTLKNRADKVRERVLGCATSNELNKLIFLGKVTEVELNWLVQNYLTSTEKKVIQQTQKATQGNLFSTPESESEVINVEMSEMIEAIDREMKRLGWSV